MSNSPGCPDAWRARMNTVSGANGPRASMPSARAAAMAGAMIVISSSPNRPPSPACGFSPATAMRGATMPHPAAARCAMRRVSSTASKVTASMADRSDWWTVTSTVHSSSLASIMRTGGGTAPGSAASDCSISVWPGKEMPAAASAPLCTGAVTMAATAPHRASATACSMHRAAAAPARASMVPSGAASNPAGSAWACRTGSAFGGTRITACGASISATTSPPPVSRTARRITPTSPSTKQSRARELRNSWAMISGPMPQLSPIVIKIGASGCVDAFK